MLYRNIYYTYEEWRTHTGAKASCWHCSDEKLLKGTGTVSFPTMTQDEMFEKIDDYIDRKAEHLRIQELNTRACIEFYENNPDTPKD